MTESATFQVLIIIVPGFFVGLAFFDSVRRIFSDDPKWLLTLLADQPVTMGAAATIVGSVLTWGALSLLGVV